MSNLLVVRLEKTGRLTIINRKWLLNVAPGVKISTEEIYESFISEDLSQKRPPNFNSNGEKVKVLKPFSEINLYL